MDGSAHPVVKCNPFNPFPKSVDSTLWFNHSPTGGSMFRHVDDDIVHQLAAIVGPENVLLGAERLEPYTHDETVGLRADPDVAVRVTSTQQVAEVFRLANRERL